MILATPQNHRNLIKKTLFRYKTVVNHMISRIFCHILAKTISVRYKIGGKQ